MKREKDAFDEVKELDDLIDLCYLEINSRPLTASISDVEKELAFAKDRQKYILETLAGERN